MSADNWTTCPRCRDEERHRVAALGERVRTLYGKVSVDDFDAMRDELEKGEQLEDTFREDYEFYGAEDGTVIAVYKGRCEKCELSVGFTHHEKFWDETHGEWGREGFVPDE